MKVKIKVKIIKSINQPNNQSINLAIWGNLLQKDSDRIIKLKKRVTRIIQECDISIPSNFMFSSLKWLSFTKRIR